MQLLDYMLHCNFTAMSSLQLRACLPLQSFLPYSINLLSKVDFCLLELILKIVNSFLLDLYLELHPFLLVHA